jgi:ribose transport system permease protein
MLLVLLVLCAYYSVVTYGPQEPAGAAAARQVARDAAGDLAGGSAVLVAVGGGADDEAFAEEFARRAAERGWTVIATVRGSPADARAILDRMSREGARLDAIACSRASRAWTLFDDLPAQFPRLGPVRFVTPRQYHWPTFLNRDNLRNVASQIVIFAVLAVGMTMVVITAGIDLSVGSLVALSAVVAALLIRRFGGLAATPLVMVTCCSAAVVVCAAVGVFNGAMVTLFSIPPFIATLAMMLIASGLAYRISAGQSIYELSDRFVWLGRGMTAGVPNAVLLMCALYLAAHVVMSRTTFGRYVYAIGGNTEAARLSGVPVRRIIVLVYALSGALAGVGGVILASQLKSGAPTYGNMYELYVIAAVVVGGTSLAGGEGRVLGTLIGAFIIAVIQNGMNLTGIIPYNQKIVLGAVILGAVLLDTAKRGGWRRLRLWRRTTKNALT